mmetsp:Transcript_24131/g.33839  ORF Transcript_24131/g.33839 Transcript_24131/m.33839 type:complete len:389 (-) Transcript_24131:78-1244(-)
MWKKKRGEVSRGILELVRLPTGNKVELGVIIVSGKNPGPTVLITANIHGDEPEGIIVTHRLVNQLEKQLDQLHGKVVCFPSLNPSGLLNATREPQFDNEVDPNRKWPCSRPTSQENLREYKNVTWYEIPEHHKDDKMMQLIRYYTEKKDLQHGPQEKAWAKLWKIFEDIHPNYHVDLHTFTSLSNPFIFLDRVIYDKKHRTFEDAKKLFDTTLEMVRTMGLSVVVESDAKTYTKLELHRSTSGATLNHLHIPSCTIEVGPIEPHGRDAGGKCLNNLLKWAAMLPGKVEEVTEVKVFQPEELHRWLAYPFVSQTGICDFVLWPGDRFVPGDLMAIIRDINGQVLEHIYADLEGYVIGWDDHITRYEGDTLGLVAVVDRLPPIMEWDEVN